MIDDLLLHPRSRAELTALLSDAPHAILLVGADGMGKYTVAKTWAAKLTNSTAVSVLEPDERGTITIDATRGLYQHTRTKQENWQVVIIDHAEAMSKEAQNAFLKLLEEPRQKLTFILTARATVDLLPTMLSRVQVVALHPVADQTLTEFALSVKPDAASQELAQLLFVAHGRPAVLAHILSDEQAFERLRLTMQRAKSLLNGAPYERLARIQEMCKDREDLVLTLEAMGRMLELYIRNNPTATWLALADTLQQCLRRLRQNGNPRAQLTHLFLSY